MKIVVCISHVPDTTSKIQFTSDGAALDAQGIQFVINPHDEFGLTRALQLKEAGLATQVTALIVGDASVEPTLRKALAIGADDAVRIDAKPASSNQVASWIADYLKGNPAELVICGIESIDYNGGMVPGLLAHHLGAAFVNTCIGLEITGQTATVLREIDGGKEKVTASLPLVVAGKKGLVEESELRIPNMRGIMAARTKPLAVVAPANVSANVESQRFERPTGRTAVRMVDKDNLGELVRLLHEEAKVI
jgi:electron transfer flavoprotein beta subunit